MQLHYGFYQDIRPKLKNLDVLTSDFSLTFPKELYSEKVRLR